MIFYKAIKYIIFDVCIDTLFNTVTKNIFKINSEISLNDLRQGMYLKTAYLHNQFLFGCTISRLHENGDGSKFIRLSFGYEGYGSVSTTIRENNKQNFRFFI